METELIRKARTFAEITFSRKAFEKHNFHNLSHTKEVVQAAGQIYEQLDLSDDEKESVLVAAWLHDIGYEQGSENHEEIAAEKARELLQQAGASHKKIEEITDAIIDTKMPQQPRTMVSKILCDADLFHLSTENCDETGLKLREEWKSLGYKDMTDEEWATFNLQFMETHRYHTPYGKAFLEQGKKKILKGYENY